MGKFSEAMAAASVIELPADPSKPYLVLSVTGVAAETAMKRAMPFIADGWEVVSTISGTVNAIALRLPNPAYGTSA